MTLEHSLSHKVRAYALSQGICTKCFTRPIRDKGTTKGLVKWCAVCRDSRDRRKKEYLDKHGTSYNRDYYEKYQVRKKQYQKKYRAKLKVEKTKERDIKKAVEAYQNL